MPHILSFGLVFLFVVAYVIPEWGGRSLSGQAKSAEMERGHRRRGEFPGYNRFSPGELSGGLYFFCCLRKDGGFFSPNLLTSNSP